MTSENIVSSVKEASVIDRSLLETLQRERLHDLFVYARAHSPYLQKKYAKLPESPQLDEIPVSLRSELVGHFDDWVTDPEVKEDDVKKFLSDTNNIGTKFLGKYTVMTTSGTTGVPLIMLRDINHLTAHGAIMQERYRNGLLLRQVKGLEDPQKIKACAIISPPGFHSAYMSYLGIKAQFKASGKENDLLYLPVNTPLAEMEERLNAFQPDIVACYPSAMVVLALSQQAGRLNIHPKYIGCSAEQLSPPNRLLLEKTFGCPAIDNYCSTEGGEIALLCPKGHLHVNADWLILEPVDAENKPVPTGQVSDGVLLTNLANRVQPVIRYRLSDKILWHDELCGCGITLPFIEVQGREEEILIFEHGATKIPLSPTLFLLLVVDSNDCVAGQFIQRSPLSLEVRYLAKEDCPRDRLATKLKTKLDEIFRCNGLPVQVIISDEPLVRTQKGGKIRSVFKEFL